MVATKAKRKTGARPAEREMPSLTGESNIGGRIRRLRRERNMSLRDLSARTDISVSTLSKIENNVVDLTYLKVLTLAEALNVDVAELFVAHPQPASARLATARRTVTRRDSGVRQSTENYDCEYLSAEISKKRMIPVVAAVKARSIEEFGPFAPHEGEEFIYVLEGAIEIYSEHYEPVLLNAGDSVYLDCTMGHGMVARSEKTPKVLFVCTHAQPDFIAPEHQKAPAAPIVARASKRGGS